jgi:hypothetical protein
MLEQSMVLEGRLERRWPMVRVSSGSYMEVSAPPLNLQDAASIPRQTVLPPFVETKRREPQSPLSAELRV